ncbi:MAG: hypothetical protein E7124_09650 [Bacteroidales bacterium]|nr:hypothetical protein [Bacteroidales bacterium]
MKKLINIAVASLLLGCMFSCQKSDEEPTAAEPIGTYVFKGEECPVHSAIYASNNVSLMIRISPLLKPIEEQTTYAIIGINTALEGETIDVGNAWNNDDYYFRYEDPVYYYSVYRKLQSGTIRIQRTGADKDIFDISVDVVLPDGTDFSFEYRGPITSATL